MSNATRKLVNILFSKYGLVIIDANNKNIKTLFKDLIFKEVSEKLIHNESKQSFFGFTNRKIFYLIIENPVYGCNASGMLIPSSVWKFSIIVARTLGNARELPFNV